ncbi:hypothetical protein JCM14469_16690 [Desulfatiferula olefinivorans]
MKQSAGGFMMVILILGSVFGTALASDQNPCTLKPDPGPCKALFTRYYFDAERGACRSFFWGGCGGVVPFETLGACEAACGAGAKTVGPPAPSDTIWKGSASHQKEPFIAVITSSEAWTDLWKRAFDAPAPDVDFTRLEVACVFLGHSADGFYAIGFGRPFMRDNHRVIPYTLADIVLELSEPFQPKGQYLMQVIDKTPGVETVLEENDPRYPRRE